MKDFLFKLKIAWKAYKTAGDILAAEKAFREECKYELTERAKMDRLDASGNQVVKPPFNVLECAPDAHFDDRGMPKPMTASEVIARVNEYHALHPLYQDAVISKPRVVQRKPNVTMAKRRKNANKRKTK